jgi:CCDC81-like HU domain protein/sporulation related protein
VALENVEKYLSELLFEHDCVIVPAFGGFVARSSSSYFAKTGNVLLPPSKSIVFNKNLSNNDGLLAGYIMQKESATYQQANTIIENFVSNCRQLLETQKRFEINGLGLLYRNNENTILFEQNVRINYNPNAFGLPVVSAVKLVKEEKVIELKPNLQYREITPVQKPKTARRIVFAASGAVLIVTLILFTSKQNIFDSALASLNPFWANSKATVVKSKFKIQNSEIKVAADTAAINSTLKTLPDTSNIDKTSVVKPVKIVEEWYKQPYQIVVGCFAVKQNAYKLINQLEGQNLTVGIVGQNAKNLYVVSVAGYEDKEAARKKLSEIKEQYPAAWLYKR